MEKEVIVNGRKFIVKEILAIDIDNANINWDDVNDSRKKQLILATGLSEDEYNKLTFKERLQLQKIFNELNIADFQ